MLLRSRFAQSAPRILACASLFCLLLPFAASSGVRADEPQVLVVGGGPDPQNNQVAIESNVRYILRLLSSAAPRTILFADGDQHHKTVLYEENEKALSDSQRILTLLLEGDDAAHPTVQKFRAPNLVQLDGAAKKERVTAAFERLWAQTDTHARPLLLYFTGHGSPGKNHNLENNVFDLWDGTLSVHEMAANLAKLPADRQVIVVMVQCYSGAFGNLLFADGEPLGAPIDRDMAGFFATIKERTAAGCTPEVDEKEYHDFTSYFFAALTGIDRVGRRVTGADYNGDGRVGMDEAFCYTLIHDVSIDIPVCTSDIFLRRYVRTPDQEVFRTPYSRVREWATPAQRAALDALSQSLHLDGEDRGESAYRLMPKSFYDDSRKSPYSIAYNRYSQALQDASDDLFARLPALRNAKSSGYAAARTVALRTVQRQLQAGRYRALLEAERALSSAEDEDYRRELAEARQIRFVRLFKSVVLAHTLRENGEEEIKRRFSRLAQSESRSPLTSVDTQRSAARQSQ